MLKSFIDVNGLSLFKSLIVSNTLDATTLQYQDRAPSIKAIASYIDTAIEQAFSSVDGRISSNASAISTHTSNSTIHVTSGDKSTWNSKYSKPSTGIPETDLASGVKSALSSARSALQQHQSVSSANNTASFGKAVVVGSVGGTDLKFTMPALNVTDTKNTVGSTNTTSKIFLVGTTSQTTYAQSYSNVNIYTQSGELYVDKTKLGKWNDLADAIPVDKDCILEHGYCYCFDGERYYKSSKYLEDGIIGIHSDTYGIKLGNEEGTNKLDVAVAGFVLAYVDKQYPVGTPLTCTENGYLTEIKKEDKIEYPEKIVATYWKPEKSETWGPEDKQISVNGRHWVKVK